MKEQLIFRIFVDISTYTYEVFVMRDFVFCSISFLVVHVHSILGYGSLKAFSIK